MLSRFGCRILKYLGELGTWEEDGTRKERKRKKKTYKITYLTILYTLQADRYTRDTLNKHTHTHSIKVRNRLNKNLCQKPCASPGFSAACVQGAESRAALHATPAPAAPCLCCAALAGYHCPPAHSSVRHPQKMLQP